MFDFGNDDKEKLRENMEQIKEMVNEGESIGEDQAPPGFDQDIGGFGDDTTGFDDSGEGQQFDQPQQDSPGGDEVESFDSPGDEISADSPGEDEDLERELDEFEQKFGEDQDQQGSQQSFQDVQQQQPQQDQQEKQGQQPQPDDTAPNSPPPNQQRSQTTQGGVKDSRDTQQLESDLPSPPETRELNVPDIDRGPLFLRQRKFLRAKQMIEDMLYLSDEMEKTVNDLEAGLQEDKDIERDVVEILREFEDNRTEVEDIISPREE